jgi:hypothetical protein
LVNKWTNLSCDVCNSLYNYVWNLFNDKYASDD